MGLSASWIAVHGRTPAEILQSLDLEETGEAGDFLESRLSYAVLPAGWTLVMGTAADWATPDVISPASVGGVAVACQIEEHVMFSRAYGFENGMQKWSLLHYLDEDKILDVEGEPPAEFVAIRDDLFRQQEEDDRADYIFDIPVALTAAICGFHPNEDRPGASPEMDFQYLQRPRKPRAPGSPGPFAWLGRIFSKPN
jgi:hypothetical protein